MTDRPSLARAHWIAIIVPAALLAGAYVSEYVFGLYPCEMCWWQRWPHFAALALALLAFIVPGKRFWVALAGICILVSGAIGGFHAGVEYSWWEGITACTGAIGAGEDALDAIMNAPIIRCDVAAWSMFGISLAGWNFVISSLTGVAVLSMLARKA